MLSSLVFNDFIGSVECKVWEPECVDAIIAAVLCEAVLCSGSILDILIAF